MDIDVLYLLYRHLEGLLIRYEQSVKIKTKDTIGYSLSTSKQYLKKSFNRLFIVYLNFIH